MRRFPMAAAWVLVVGLASAPMAARAQSLPAAETYRLRVEGFTRGGGIEGEVQKGFGSNPGTLLDLVDDLAVEGKRTYGISGTIQFVPGIKLRGSYAKLDYSGDTIAARPFTFGLSNFSGGDRVVTTVRGTYYTGALEWDFVKSGTGYLGAFVGVKVLDGDFVLVSPSAGKRDVESGIAPLPVLGIASRVYTSKRISVETEISGMTIGHRGTVYEIVLATRFHFSDRIAAMAGYRRFKLTARPTEDRDYLSVKLAGLVFGVELSL